MQDVTWLEMFKHGWFVISVLLFISLISVTVLVDRMGALRKATLNPAAFIRQVLSVFEKQGRAVAVEFCARYPQPLARVVRLTLQYTGTREAREAVLRRAVRHERRNLETNISSLGTIASIAPFVGLLGTVLGIIRAFKDIAASSGGGPQVVAVGIAEALLATALGLLVAIPAVVGYNYCVTRIRRLIEEVELSALEVLEKTTELENPPS